VPRALEIAPIQLKTFFKAAAACIRCSGFFMFYGTQGLSILAKSIQEGKLQKSKISSGQA
jgi:hypothetical protein